MTKGGSAKSKTLGRLIFGEKRKQHASPARHRSSTRNRGSLADLSAPPVVTTPPPVTSRARINLHDWAVWRMQLNEQMAAVKGESRADLRSMRQYLQSNAFYQQHSRDPSTGRYTGVRLLFSIPRAKFKPEYLDGLQGRTAKAISHELGEAVNYEQNYLQTHSDDRTTTSVNSISALQPLIMDKAISQFLPKGLATNFLQINEPFAALDAMRTRPTLRCSYTASDRIHSTLQKAVKDGNVLEKIKAFEMQAAAAAQAESTTKSVASSTGVNHRMQPVPTSMQSVAHRTLSPAIVHLMQHPLSPLPVPSHQQPSQSSRGRHGHSGQQRHGETRQTPQGAPAKKGAHVLEPAHGDVILKRRTPSQITVNDEDYSITAISSMALNSSKDHRRTSASRSRPKHEKRSPSKNDTQAHRQKRATTPTSKSTPRRRWLKGRKETTPEAPPQQTEKQEIPATKSKSKKVPTPKPVDPKKTSSSSKKGQAVASSDNNRHHGLTTAKEVEEEKKEAARAPLPIPDESEYHSDDEQHPLMNRYMILKHDDSSQGRREEMIIVAAPQRRSMKKPQQQKLSSTDGEILSKVDEDTRFSRPTDGHADQSELDDEEHSDGDVFLDEPIVKPKLPLSRHQSVLNPPNGEARRLPQQPGTLLRRHASQCSADEIMQDRRAQRAKENTEVDRTHTLKKKPSPITILTRKNKSNQNEPLVYDAPLSELTQPPVCNTNTLKKKRPFHTLNTSGQTNNKQISKQILHAIMNSMNNNQDPTAPIEPSATDEFFDNGPLSNPEESLAHLPSDST